MNQASTSPQPAQETAVTVERRGHVLLMGLNRPGKRNAFNLAMLEQLAAAYYELDRSSPRSRANIGRDQVKRPQLMTT